MKRMITTSSVMFNIGTITNENRQDKITKKKKVLTFDNNCFVSAHIAQKDVVGLGQAPQQLFPTTILTKAISILITIVYQETQIHIS